MELQDAELDAINEWLLIKLKETAGPEQMTNVDGLPVYMTSDIMGVLFNVSPTLALAFADARDAANVGETSNAWDRLAERHPELIVLILKAGAEEHLH